MSTAIKLVHRIDLVKIVVNSAAVETVEAVIIYRENVIALLVIPVLYVTIFVLLGNTGMSVSPCVRAKMAVCVIPQPVNAIVCLDGWVLYALIVVPKAYGVKIVR